MAYLMGLLTDFGLIYERDRCWWGEDCSRRKGKGSDQPASPGVDKLKGRKCLQRQRGNKREQQGRAVCASLVLTEGSLCESGNKSACG